MTTRILIDPDGSALLVEPGTYLLWEPEFPILVPAARTIDVRAIIQPTVGGVSAARRVIDVTARGTVG